ncbi:MAG: hypothetical protein J2P35_03995 [Actinobacteria bacterium]|nr:hypothetical protein [Actinomycetota bacterium]
MARGQVTPWLGRDRGADNGSADRDRDKSKAALLGGLAAVPESLGFGIFVVGVLEAL